MKTLTALLLLTSSLNSFSQEKIPAVDLKNPPTSAPVMSVSTVEETPAPITQVKENGCTQNFTNNNGLFIQDKKRFRSMTPLEKDPVKQTIKQGVVTGSGTEIRYIISNCTHKIIVINMAPKRLQAAMPHHAFRQASTLLSAFQSQSDREQLAEISPLRKALARNNWEQIKSENGKFTLPCIDAKCTLEVIKVGGIDKEIELTYDTVK